MKQSEIQESVEYIIDSDVVDQKKDDSLGYGYRTAFRTLDYGTPITARVIGLNRKLHQYRERKDAVLIEFTGAALEAIKASPDYAPEKFADQYALNERALVLARRVVEPVATYETREAERVARRQAEEDAERQRLADRAEGIHPAYIGSLIEETEREASRAADKLKGELENLIERAQKNLDALDEGTTTDRERRPFWGGLAPADEDGNFPYLNDIFLEGALRDVGKALTNYNDYRAQHVRWQQAISVVEAGV